jgi:hypothetical protein
MYIITDNKVTFRLLFSHQDAVKDADRHLQLNEFRKVCCTRTAEYILRPGSVLIHGLAAKIKVLVILSIGLNAQFWYLSVKITEIVCIVDSMPQHP